MAGSAHSPQPPDRKFIDSGLGNGLVVDEHTLYSLETARRLCDQQLVCYVMLCGARFRIVRAYISRDAFT